MLTIDQIIDSTEGFGVIYMLTSPSGKSYIGQSVVFKHRYNVYKYRKKNSIGKKLYHALNKYNGIENFEVKILCKIAMMEDLLEMRDKLSKEEIYYINLYDTFNSGYNSTLGGEGALGRKTSKETKEKLSKINKGKNKKEKLRVSCATCNKEFFLKPYQLRIRLKRSPSKRLYCCVECSYAGLKKENSYLPESETDK